MCAHVHTHNPRIYHARCFNDRPQIFEDYIINNLKHFKDAEDGEHRLGWTEIFNDYLKVFEDVLAEFIDQEGGDYGAFYDECREKQSHGSPEERHFLKLLLASADYQDFSRIMVREARFYYATGMSSFGRVAPEDMDDEEPHISQTGEDGGSHK